MKAIPITQKCKSPLKLDDTTLAAASFGNKKFSETGAAKVAQASSVVGDALTNLGKK